MNFMDLWLLLLILFNVLAAWTLYTRGRGAKILLTLFWSFLLVAWLFHWAQFYMAPSDFIVAIFALVGLISLSLNLTFPKKFPNFWIFYPYGFFFIGTVFSNVVSLFNKAPFLFRSVKGAFIFVYDKIYWYTLSGLLAILGVAGLYTLFKGHKLACTLIFIAIFLLKCVEFFLFDA